MASKIPIPDTHPNVHWRVPHRDKVTFVFNADVDSFEVEPPDYFDPRVEPGAHKKGDKIRCVATTPNQTVHFKYSPDTSSTLAGAHTILIGN
jgi:hypothetical protein